jgi:hypothetical protein
VKRRAKLEGPAVQVAVEIVRHRGCARKLRDVFTQMYKQPNEKKIAAAILDEQ